MKRRQPAFTDFMDRAKCARFAERMRGIRDLNVVLFGGTEDCERQIMGFSLAEEEISEKERMMNVLETEFIRLLNEERVQKGRGELQVNEILHKAARIRAEECLEKFSHTRPNGKSYKLYIVGKMSKLEIVLSIIVFSIDGLYIINVV